MKTRLLLYCTKNKWRLFFDKVKQVFTLGKVKSNNDLNGKIVAECDFEVESINVLDCTFRTFNLVEKEILNKSCLTYKELFEYLKNRDNPRGYAIHIKNLHIFDKPRFIQDYSKNENPYNYIENAPQNMMYAFDVKSFNESEKKVLISIRPEYLVDILNGNKTIEIRKKVLKEMLNNE